MRKALRLWLKHQQPKHHQVIALWRDRPDYSLTIQHALRKEW